MDPVADDTETRGSTPYEEDEGMDAEDDAEEEEEATGGGGNNDDDQAEEGEEDKTGYYNEEETTSNQQHENGDGSGDDGNSKEESSSNLPAPETPKQEPASQETPASTPGTAATAATNNTGTGDKRKKRKGMPAGLGGSKKGRSPAVRGLTIPFRTVKKAMKLDPDIPIVQNEAAIMTTLASELFLKSLAKESHGNAKARGRNTIRYEDVAEARTKKPSLAFLETLMP